MPSKQFWLAPFAALVLPAVQAVSAQAADLLANPPAPAPAPPPRVVYVQPPQPRVYIPPAYDQPGVRWRNGYWGHGWKRYNGWWFPPQGFTFNTVPPNYAPAPPFNPGHTAQQPSTTTVIQETDVVTVAPIPAPGPVYAQPPAAPVQPPALTGDVRVQHVNWCLERYRSYLVADNTYQPYEGPRQICNSPFWP
ncbi:BA14K-like protein [Roseibium hamelinense]|uniref:Lectin-like protein BA14k n=1 Tax=Roseibium hamelinense TaxID=150831 RepID=A0A562TBR1_9HYPH|nr:BA14K family protein [Roseibium hamelinense]MTI45163.1 BA14K family protein [Roseibium hamelinense]TWI90476.1 BA14K-like protein [Roseibium hamelinense]